MGLSPRPGISRGPRTTSRRLSRRSGLRSTSSPRHRRARISASCSSRSHTHSRGTHAQSANLNRVVARSRGARRRSLVAPDRDVSDPRVFGLRETTAAALRSRTGGARDRVHADHRSAGDRRRAAHAGGAADAEPRDRQPRPTAHQVRVAARRLPKGQFKHENDNEMKNNLRFFV